MTTLFRKEYPQKSRATEFLFLILFIVLMIPISPLIFVWAIGKIIEPVSELYNDVVWASFNTLHNKINPYKENWYGNFDKKRTGMVERITGSSWSLSITEKIGFYTIGDKSIYLYDLRRMDEIMEALDNRSSMDWCVAVHDMNAGFDEKILFPSSVESTAG